MATKSTRPKATRKSVDNGTPGVLVDHQIQAALKKKLLQIEPFDKQLLEPATYDLRVGTKSIISTASEVVENPPHGLIFIEPGAMAIVETFEVLRLSRRIVARVGPKSSLLRRGIFLSVGPQIDPGFHGRLIVNLINLSPRPFSLHVKDKFLTVEFQLLSAEPTRGYEGRYQDRMQLSGEDLELLLAYQGPTLADLHRGFFEIKDNIREISALRHDFALFFEKLQKGIIDDRSRDTVPFQTQVTTFVPEPYSAMKPIPVVVRENIDGSFTASFFDANIEASGENEEEAIWNVKSLILDIFEQLREEPPSKLGPRVAAQLAVLETFIEKEG